MIKWMLYQGYKDSSISTNQSLWYTILTDSKIKPYDHLNKCRERLWQNSVSFMIKNNSESRQRKNIPQHSKGHTQQTHRKHYTQWWKTKNISSKIRNKTRVPTLATIIQNSFGSPSHNNHRRKRNKMNQDWKRRSKTLQKTWMSTKKILKMSLEKY